MTIYLITSNYFDSGVFGSYSTVKRARIAFEDFLADDENIVAFRDIEGYFYEFTTKIGETFDAEIISSLLDEEFEEGICKED